MAFVQITIPIPNIKTIAAHFDRIKVWRSTTGLTGTYSEVTTATTRPVIVSTSSSYSFTDETGAATYYYKISYLNSKTSKESTKSDAMLGETDAADDIISIDELKSDYLFGVDMTDDRGEPFPDSLFRRYIRGAASYVQRLIDVPLRPEVISDPPELHDFNRHDYSKWIFIQLLKFPVISVEDVSLYLPNSTKIITYDPTWIQLDKDSGQLHIVPGSGQLVLGASGMWLPLLAGHQDFVPNCFRVQYTAGFSKVPPEIVELVAKLAAIPVLDIAGDLVYGAGIASERLGLDSLFTEIKTTQSATNSGYGARILSYTRQIKEQIKTIRLQYKGVRITVA